MLLGWLSLILSCGRIRIGHVSQTDLAWDPEALELMMRGWEIPSCKWAEAEDPYRRGANLGSPQLPLLKLEESFCFYVDALSLYLWFHDTVPLPTLKDQVLK